MTVLWWALGIVGALITATIIAGTRLLWRRGKKAVGEGIRRFDDRMTEVAAGIASPIVDKVGDVARSVDGLHRTMDQHHAECRMDREAIWAYIGGRPRSPVHVPDHSPRRHE